MIYNRRDNKNTRIEGLQFTGPESVKKIEELLGVRCQYYKDQAILQLSNGDIAERGDYVFTTGFLVFIKKPKWFERRFKVSQEQGELF